MVQLCLFLSCTLPLPAGAAPRHSGLSRLISPGTDGKKACTGKDMQSLRKVCRPAARRMHRKNALFPRAFHGEARRPTLARNGASGFNVN